MSRTKWYQGLIVLVVILFISTVWITEPSENSSASLVSLTSLFELPKYGFICWFIWKYRRKN